MHPVLFHIGFLVVPSSGALAAVGVVSALVLALRTARKLHVDPNRIWNLSIIMLFTALVGSRLLLVVANWTVLRRHPMWMLNLAMVHHPILAAIGSLIAVAVAVVYARVRSLPLRTTADVLAAPAALGLGFEQSGALMAGSGYGTGARVPWAVVYTDPLAARWSDAPLGIAVHPVQAYAGLCFFAIAVVIMLWLPHRRQNGDLAGIFLITSGATLFITEFWRDPVGRGAVLKGILKGPQVAGVVLVVLGALVLLERTSEHLSSSAIAMKESRMTEPPRSTHD